jgi:hypothetical protein
MRPLVACKPPLGLGGFGTAAPLLGSAGINVGMGKWLCIWRGSGGECPRGHVFSPPPPPPPKELDASQMQPACIRMQPGIRWRIMWNVDCSRGAELGAPRRPAVPRRGTFRKKWAKWLACRGPLVLPGAPNGPNSGSLGTPRGTARSRQGESKEVGEVGSKRASSRSKYKEHHVWWGGLFFRLLDIVGPKTKTNRPIGAMSIF